MPGRVPDPTCCWVPHFDTRLFADEDPDPALRTRPVTGANDGASGVAVLMELARALETDKTGHRICLAFFDAEDNGNIPEWHWILGSSAFAADLDRLPACNAPTAVVIVDMVGDSRQELPLERTSTPELQAAIWQQAAELGPGRLVPAGAGLRHPGRPPPVS